MLTLYGGRHIVSDQIRAVDRARLVRTLGRLSPQALKKALQVLAEMFVPQEAIREVPRTSENRYLWPRSGLCEGDRGAESC